MPPVTASIEGTPVGKVGLSAGGRWTNGAAIRPDNKASMRARIGADWDIMQGWEIRLFFAYVR
jgi:hypothetical protein